MVKPSYVEYFQGFTKKEENDAIKFFENLGIYKHHSINWFNTNPKITRDQMQNILKTGNIFVSIDYMINYTKRNLKK